MSDQPLDEIVRDLGDVIRSLRAGARAARGIYPAPPPPRLRLVTEANAHEFSTPPKKRGRQRKVVTAGNVVALADTASARRIDAMAVTLGVRPDARNLPAVRRQIEVVANLLDQRKAAGEQAPRPAPRKYDDQLQRQIEAYVRYAVEEWERSGVVPMPQLT